jgi:two-component system, cell cycle response regulator
MSSACEEREGGPADATRLGKTSAIEAGRRASNRFSSGGLMSSRTGEWVETSLRDARILVIDDDPLQCRHFSQLVEGWSAVAFTATSLAEALRLYRTVAPDLVMLDVLMPHVDGYKLSQIFKREGPFVPIILLTGLDDLESKRRGLAAGADEFLTKPVNEFELQIRVSSMLRIKRLADELEAANSKLKALAAVDALTQLPNRRVLSERLAFEFTRAARYFQPLSCLMVDVDYFKKVNDTYGHPIGDKVLIEVAATLQRTIRVTDMVGRYGGEEFMVILPQTKGADARIAGERLRRAVATRPRESADVPEVTISVGAAAMDKPPAASVDELVRQADQALYKAKEAGRNRVVVWDGRSEAPG